MAQTVEAKMSDMDSRLRFAYLAGNLIEQQVVIQEVEQLCERLDASHAATFLDQGMARCNN